MKTLTTILFAALLVGCGTLYKSIVTVTEVRDQAMKELATLHKAGLISAETDAKIANADIAYRKAAEVTVAALEAYKVSGDKTQYLAALKATKAALNAILDILTPLIGSDKSSDLFAKLANAQQL